MDHKPFIAPWWVEETEIFLEAQHGDLDSLLTKHEGPLLKRKAHQLQAPRKGRPCPNCGTVFQYTRYGNDSCPFCRSQLNFSI